MTPSAPLSIGFVAMLGLAAVPDPSPAAPIGNPVAVFNGLDKVTGRLHAFKVEIGETVQFGALQVTPRICNTRPPTEPAQTTAFVEVDEVTLQNQAKRIFAGWMFAASPGLHAVEHPVYDVWLTDCAASMEEVEKKAAPTIDLDAKEAPAAEEGVEEGAEPAPDPDAPVD